MIDPLEYRAPNSLESAGFFPTALFEDHASVIPLHFFESVRVYDRELAALSRMRRPDGRPLFYGLGLYPEIGADLMPVAHTREHGRLVGLSLHEGEVITGCATLLTFGYNPDEVLGGYVNSGPIQRDVAGAGVEKLGGESLEWVRSRMSMAKRRFGRVTGVPAKDWERFGRYINWEHFTFLPSISGDERILTDYLEGQAQVGTYTPGRKFDYLILKGPLGYRFHDQQKHEHMPEYERWLARLDERFLADDALVFVSHMETPAKRILEGRGYQKLDLPKLVQYPDEVPTVQVSGARHSREIAGIRLLRGHDVLAFTPLGDFTLLQKSAK